MKQSIKITVRLSPELHKKATYKCKQQLDICLSTLIKIFLTSFVTQKGVGFYVGDQDLRNMIRKWLTLKKWGQGSTYWIPGATRLKDIFDLP